MASEISRRGLFRLLSGSEHKSPPLPDIPAICPPWARGKRDYLALCERCTLCADACPERIIRPLSSDEEALDGIAILNLDYGECTFCGKCVEACPTGALDYEQGDKEQAVVHLTGTCDRAVGMPCTMCMDSCPVQAITLDKSAPIIDTALCTGCGTCTLSCYSRALTMVKRSSNPQSGQE